MKIHKGSTNVYADLDRTDAGEMLVKAQLAAKIAKLTKRRRMTPVQASDLFDMPPPKVSALLRGQFRGISEKKDDALPAHPWAKRADHREACARGS